MLLECVDIQTCQSPNAKVKGDETAKCKRKGYEFPLMSFPHPCRSDRALIGGFLQLYQVSSSGGEQEEVKLTEGGPCVSML